MAVGLVGDKAQQVVAAYLDELTFERRLSRHTLAAYRHDLRVLLEAVYRCCRRAVELTPKWRPIP